MKKKKTFIDFPREFLCCFFFYSVWLKLDREREVWRRNAIFGFIVHQIGTFIKVRKMRINWMPLKDFSFFLSNMQFHFCAVSFLWMKYSSFFSFPSFFRLFFYSTNIFLQNHTPSNQQPFTISILWYFCSIHNFCESSFLFRFLFNGNSNNVTKKRN